MTERAMKRCRQGDVCVHPNGPLLPASEEYFYASKTLGGFSSRCKLCTRRRKSLWKQSHPEQVAEQKRRYWAKHPNKRLEQRDRARERQGYKKLLRAEQKRRTKLEKERLARIKHVQSYVDRARRMLHGLEMARIRERERKHRRNALKRRLPADFTPKDWRYALEYFDHRCAICRRSTDHGRVLAHDHWIPLSKYGSFTPRNIVPLCHGVDGCNNKKLAKDPHDWLVKEFGPSEALMIEQRIYNFFQTVRGANLGTVEL